MSKRTEWTEGEVIEFEAWHESVIAQYPQELQQELRRDRVKWLAQVPRIQV